MKKMSRPKIPSSSRKRYLRSTKDLSKSHHSTKEISTDATPDVDEARIFTGLARRRSKPPKKYPHVYGYRSHIVKNITTRATPKLEEDRIFSKKPKGDEKP